MVEQVSPLGFKNMKTPFRIFCIGFIGFAISFLLAYEACSTEAEATTKLTSFLDTGRFSEGEQFFQKQLAAAPQDQTIRASLGVVQFLHALEIAVQDMYRYGTHTQRRVGFLIELPNSVNPAPDEIGYEDARSVLERLLEGVLKAERTLAEFKPANIKLPIDVTTIRVDIDRDGKISESENFLPVLARMINGRRQINTEKIPSLVFAFDDADVYWLRGYLNVLSGSLNVMLAYDWKEAFERTAHLVFLKPKTPHTFLLKESDKSGFSVNQFLDVIAFIHLLNFEVKEPERMKAALKHFEDVISISRQTWKQIRQETDNDREWLPGPNQTSVLLSNRVGGRMGDDWEQVLDRVELVIQGKELLPFWRGVDNGDLFSIGRPNREVQFNPELGINLRKVFTDPQRLDFIMVMQGTGMTPFLEKGKLVDFKAWSELSDAFQGRLPFFAFWIN